MENENFKNAVKMFTDHYGQRLENVTCSVLEDQDGIAVQCTVNSVALKEGNSPELFLHEGPAKDVVVLTHGLSDSPYYMKAIARRFYAEGANIVIPLLPAHGLKEPDKAMEDSNLDTKWKEEIDNAVDVALLLGERVSLGGFSTGGALSLNKILRTPEKVGGGLFLFSGALDLGLVAEEASRLRFVQAIVRMTDGKLKGKGRNRYKYPELPKFAGLELGQIIRQNVDLIKNKKITQPAFSAHSVHDTTVRIEGIIDLLKDNVEHGLLYAISENVPHDELPLAKNITLDETETEGPEKEPQANPKFDFMMDDAVRFYRENVVGR